MYSDSCLSIIHFKILVFEWRYVFTITFFVCLSPGCGVPNANAPIFNIEGNSLVSGR